MKLTVVVPVYNERDTVEQAIRAVQATGLDHELIVVDDGSDDGTTEIIQRLQGPGVRVICQPQRMGKGMAIRTALPHAQGQVVVIHDADLEYDPRDFRAMLEPIIKDEAQVVYGTRFWKRVEGIRLANRIINRLLAWLANLLFRAGISDEATCYKMLRTDLLKSIPLQCRGFEFCPEITAKVRRRGVRIAEVPISYRARPDQSSKKIRWTDGIKAITTLLHYRLWE